MARVPEAVCFPPFTATCRARCRRRRQAPGLSGGIFWPPSLFQIFRRQQPAWVARADLRFGGPCCASCAAVLWLLPRVAAFPHRGRRMIRASPVSCAAKAWPPLAAAGVGARIASDFLAGSLLCPRLRRFFATRRRKPAGNGLARARTGCRGRQDPQVKLA